jgi:hypothetical protein
MASSSTVLGQSEDISAPGEQSQPAQPASPPQPPGRSPVAAAGVIRVQVVEECEAMTRYALGSGLGCAAWILELIERARAGADGHAGASRSIDPYESGEWDVASLGITAQVPLGELARAHAALAQLILPATPRGILLLSRGRRQGRLKALGPVRLIRQMLVVVIVMLAAFVLLATSPDINSSSGDIFRSSGLPLLLNELFYLAAGGLGAAFYALFTAYRYIAEGTYDTTYESSYWIRFILGLIAGVVLPSLIPISRGGNQGNVTRPLLALLGGFSAAVLYRILQRLVQTVESLAEGDSRPAEAARQEAATARAIAQFGQDRLALIGSLVRLRDQLATGQRTEQVRDSVEKLLATLATPGTTSNSSDPSP